MPKTKVHQPIKPIVKVQEICPPAAKHPFQFVSCSELIIILGQKAVDEQQLMDILEEVPEDSIFHHTHRFLLRHQTHTSPYPNDFATWAAIQVRDRALAENLAMIDPCDYPDLNDLRDAFILAIDKHLTKSPTVPRVAYDGQPFHFLSSQIISAPTSRAARNLLEFRQHLTQVSAQSIYYHSFEAIRRGIGRGGDFAHWVETGLGAIDLAAQFRSFNPHMHSLEKIRARLIKYCDDYLTAHQELSRGN